MAGRRYVPRRTHRSLLARAAVLALALAAVGMLLTPRQARPGAFVWNFTPSVPLGLYHIDEPSWAKGDRVAVRLDAHLANILDGARVLEPGRLLLKRVAAAGGDIVCRDGADVSINGAVAAHAKAVDGHGVQLPSWSGCQTLGSNRVLLLGEMPESFDGRYFGSTAAADIVGRISPVILLPGDRYASADNGSR